MTEDKPKPDPLIEWNRLNKENNENVGASKMFVVLLTRFPAELGNYASWFTAGVGAVVVLLLSNVDKVAPYLGAVAYARSIAWFGAAIGLGALCKLLATYVTALMAMQEEISNEIQATLQRFNADAAKIQDLAKQRNIDLNTEFNLMGLMEKFQSQLGVVLRYVTGWAISRTVKSNNPILCRFRMPMRLAQVEALCFALSLMAAIFGIASVAGSISGKAWGERQQQAIAAPTKIHCPCPCSARGKHRGMSGVRRICDRPSLSEIEPFRDALSISVLKHVM